MMKNLTDRPWTYISGGPWNGRQIIFYPNNTYSSKGEVYKWWISEGTVYAHTDDYDFKIV
jgi:hypothetical protein